MNRHPGAGDDVASERLFPVRISSLIFAFAAALIVLFALAMLYVGMRSSEEADRRAYESDLELFDNTLNNRFALLARDQYSFAIWTGHLAELSGRGDAAGHIESMIDSLWYGFGHDRTLLIGADGKVLADAHDGTILRGKGTLLIDADLKLLLERAAARFTAEAAGDVGNLFEAAFQNIEDRPALLSAMPLPGPEDAAGAPPVILVSVKFVDGDLLEYLNAQLGFKALHFNINPPDQLPPTHKLLATPSGQKLGAFLWADDYPGAEIWSVIWPLIAIIGILMTVTALLLARQLAGMANVVEHSERRTRYMARHDSLTGLANRLAFGEALQAAITRLDQAPFAVMACDLDRFKAVNDTYGHAAGDKVIRDVAARMAEIVGTAGLVSRTGGDEFIILLQGDAGAPSLGIPALEELGKRLIIAVSAPIDLEPGLQTDVGVSLGIAEAPACGTTAAAIMRAADEALYEAKATGRGRLVFAGDRLLRHAGQPDAQPATAHG